MGIAGYLPVQSLYLPDISWYFVTSITYNLITIIWYVYQNRCLTKAEIPGWIGFFGEKLKKLFCLCFPTDKNKKDDKHDGIKVENGQKTMELAEDKSVSPKQESDNELRPSMIAVILKDDIQVPIHFSKDKPEEICEKCDRCEKCEADYQKEDAKKKKKKDVESKLEALNYFVFIIILIGLVATQLGIWVNLKRK